MELFVNLPKYNRLKIVEKRITHHEQLHTGNREKKSNGDETKKKQVLEGERVLCPHGGIGQTSGNQFGGEKNQYGEGQTRSGVEKSSIGRMDDENWNIYS